MLLVFENGISSREVVIIFCPTGVLHGVSLHAATLKDDGTGTLLERNPVLYTTSMATFEQCVSKELSETLHTGIFGGCNCLIKFPLSHSGKARVLLFIICGDELLGIVSALLCTGAASVIRAMWKVKVGTARLFTAELATRLNDVTALDGDEKGLVNLTVTAQQTVIRLKRRCEGGTHYLYKWATFVLNGSWMICRRKA